MFYITYIAIACGILSVAAGSFVLYKRPDRLGRYFGLYIVFIAIWMIGNAGADRAATDFALRWWSGWCVVGGVGLVSWYLCFVEFFVTERPLGHLRRAIIFVPAIIFSMLGFTPLYVVETIFIPGAPAQIVPSPLNYLILSYSTIGNVYGLVRLIRHYGAAPYRKRKQIVYLAVGFFVLTVGGSILTIILPFRGEYRFFTLGSLSSLAAIGCGAYAIFRHQLLDIRIVIQRGFIYTVMLVSGVGLYAGLLFLSIAFFQSASRSTYFVSALVTAVIGMFTGPLIDKKLRAWTDPIFFKDTYRFSSAIKELSEIVSRYNRLSDIITFSAEALRRILRIREVCFCLKPEYGRSFLYEAASGRPVPIATLVAPLNSTDGKLFSNGFSAVVMPLILEGQIIGVVVLGPKLSGGDFTDEDRELLKAFCPQVAVALKKALLYQEVFDYSKNLQNKVAERTREIQELQEQQARLMLDISHELQTPLTIIKGELELLRQGTHDERKMLPLEKSVDRVSMFIRSLLKLAKLETEHALSPKTVVDFSALVEEVIEYVTVLANAQNVAIKTWVEPDLRIMGNREQLEQLITNLLSNAIKYIARERLVTVNVVRSEERVRFVVQDTGVGIDKDKLASLGQRFFRAATSAEGTGLGLAICQSIVKNHQGTFHIESEVGKGTTITAELPLCPANDATTR